MYSANGTASTAQITVTAEAIATVRTVAIRNTSSVRTLTTLSAVTVRTTAPVNVFVVQNAEINSTASEPRYAITSQAIGGRSSNVNPARRPDRAGGVVGVRGSVALGVTP
jgi:hypothetical protein